jgi:hypothetical protein
VSEPMADLATARPVRHVETSADIIPTRGATIAPAGTLASETTLRSEPRLVNPALRSAHGTAPKMSRRSPSGVPIGTIRDRTLPGDFRWNRSERPRQAPRPKATPAGELPAHLKTAALPPVRREKATAVGEPAAPAPPVQPLVPSTVPDGRRNAKRLAGVASQPLPSKLARIYPERPADLLHLPKQFSVGLSSVGWNRSLRPGGLPGMKITIGSPVDPRDLKKLFVAARRGEPVDLRAFKEAIASLPRVSQEDGRLLKKLLARVADSAAASDGVPSARPSLGSPLLKTLFNDPVDQKQRQAPKASVPVKNSSVPDQ